MKELLTRVTIVVVVHFINPSTSIHEYFSFILIIFCRPPGMCKVCYDIKTHIFTLTVYESGKRRVLQFERWLSCVIIQVVCVEK